MPLFEVHVSIHKSVYRLTMRSFIDAFVRVKKNTIGFVLDAFFQSCREKPLKRIPQTFHALIKKTNMFFWLVIKMKHYKYVNNVANEFIPFSRRMLKYYIDPFSSTSRFSFVSIFTRKV